MSTSSLSPDAIASNRLNARKSTGPRTPRGKAIAAQNALRHGLFARDLLLAGESADELLELKTATITRLNPRDAFELELVERVVVALWKLRRLQRFERTLYLQQPDPCAGTDGYALREQQGLGHREPIPAEVVWHSGGEGFQQQLDRIENHQHRLENGLHRALRQLEKLRKEEIEPPSAFAEEALASERQQQENWQNEAAESEALTRKTQLLDAKSKRDEKRVVRLENQLYWLKQDVEIIDEPSLEERIKQAKARRESRRNKAAGAELQSPRADS